MNKANKQDKTGSVLEWPIIARILTYTRKYKWLFVLSFGFTVLDAFIAPVLPFFFQQILDGPVSDGNLSGLRWWILILLGILFARTLLLFFSSFLTNWLGQSVIRDMRTQIFNHITRLRLKYFDNNPIGALQTRCVSDVETLNQVFTQGLVGILGQLLQIIVILGVMLWTSWRLTLVVLTTLPILLYATYVFKNKIKGAFQSVRKYVSLMNTFLQEHISGMLITQIFNREEVEYKKYKKLVHQHTQANLNAVLYYSVFFPVVELVNALGIALLVWYGTSSILSGHMTFGILVAFIMYISMFFRPIRMLADRFNTLQLGMVSAERIFKVLDTHQFIDDSGQIQSISFTANDSPAIEFQKVHFAYNLPEWVLTDINFTAQPGEKIAIVGSTGSGKSTIINLLTRFYDLNRGSILIHGKNINDYTLDALRSSIGLVLQDVFLFSGTIADNISLNNPDISLEKIKEAAGHVGANTFIEALPGGYDYQVQERGATLSSGQRQLIAFARVLVYNPDILILDEATSNIDTDSEELIQAAIDKLMSNRTSIIIAHRLSTIQKADKILVMSKGKIVESGSHDELLKMKGSYFKLYQIQFEHSIG